jgi:hypothetical protein
MQAGTKNVEEDSKSDISLESAYKEYLDPNNLEISLRYLIYLTTNLVNKRDRSLIIKKSRNILKKKNIDK